MAAFPSSVVAGTIYVILKKPAKTTVAVTGAISVTAPIVERYDGSEHSLLLGAEHFGNPHFVPVVLGGGQSVHQVNGSPTTVAGNYISLAAESFTGSYSAGGSVDAAFVQTTTPAPTIKQDTYLCFWSGASGTGTLVAAFRERDILGFGPAKPVDN